MQTEEKTIESIFNGVNGALSWKKSVDDTLLEIRQTQNPFYIEELIRETQNAVYELQNKISDLVSEYNDIKRDRLLRLYTNGEIKDMFSVSGLQLKHVADHFHVSEPAASRYINGDIQDLLMRDRLFEYFKSAYKERKKRENDNAKV